jgi:hypothetical protein
MFSRRKTGELEWVGGNRCGGLEMPVLGLKKIFKIFFGFEIVHRNRLDFF